MRGDEGGRRCGERRLTEAEASESPQGREVERLGGVSVRARCCSSHSTTRVWFQSLARCIIVFPCGKWVEG